MDRLSPIIARLSTWSRAPAPHRRIYIVAGALGLLTYLLVYGPAHLIGTSPYWEMPATDERVYLMAYRHFVDAPWSWPVFESRTINEPFVASLAFWDIIPIWALINKLLSTVFSVWRDFSEHAYLGLWHALTYVLQACFGVALLRTLGHRSWRTGIVTALLIVAVPSWIYRHWHDALSAHWLELWALYLYLRTRERSPIPLQQGLAWIALLVVASLTAPYHPVMCAGILVAALLRARHLKSAAIWFPAAIVVVGLATWFAGYLAGPRTPQWGFDQESTNLLSWLVPVRSGIIGDGRWIANVMATDWQYEGYAYLGLGFLLMLALALLHPRAVKSTLWNHRFLFAVAIGYWHCPITSTSDRTSSARTDFRGSRSSYTINFDRPVASSGSRCTS